MTIIIPFRVTIKYLMRILNRKNKNSNEELIITTGWHHFLFHHHYPSRIITGITGLSFRQHYFLNWRQSGVISKTSRCLTTPETPNNLAMIIIEQKYRPVSINNTKLERANSPLGLFISESMKVFEDHSLWVSISFESGLSFLSSCLSSSEDSSFLPQRALLAVK